MLKTLFLLMALSIGGAQGARITFAEGSSDYFKHKVLGSLQLLPESFLDSVEHRVEFSEVAFDSDKHLSSKLCDLNEKVKFGATKRRWKKHKILISSALVKFAQSHEEVYPCSHKTFEKTLMATIIHEVVHVMDNFEEVSIDPDFQRIIGVKKVQGSSKREVLNQNSSSSPDAYEFKNLEEALAVNIEYLVLDPEFECRKPATANFLSKRLNLPLSGSCDKNFKIIAQSAYLEDNYQYPISIDPSRIYQVHYLFAGKGEGIMSRWGHAMFRLVVCAPHREEVGPDCLRDVSHHLALSYRAYMSDINISYIKGLFGDYPSQLFIMRFHEVQQEYTKFELRDLYSIPLKLDRDQITSFINLTLERYWTYQGRYYFINNNCGTETQKHLAVALSDDQSDPIRSLTPLRIYNDIVSTENQLTTDEFEDLKREELITEGILLPSLYSDLNEAYQRLKSAGLFKEKSFKEFMKISSAKARLASYRSYFSSPDSAPEENRILIMKLIYLERYFLSRFTMSIPNKALQLMDKNSFLKDEVMRMGQSFKSLSTHPWEVVEGLYGVPTSREFENKYLIFLEERSRLVSESAELQMENLQNILGQSFFQHELEEIENYKEIKVLTNSLILMINRF